MQSHQRALWALGGLITIIVITTFIWLIVLITSEQTTPSITTTNPVVTTNDTLPDPDNTPTEAPAVKTAQIVFGADFSNDQGCDTHGNNGCDVFLANITLEGEVTDIKQLTTEAGSEVFPVFSADGKTVYDNHWSNNKEANINWIDIANGTSGILQKGARGLAPLPDGSGAAYAPLAANSPLMLADFTSAHTLANARAITGPGDFNEPHASALGDIIFNELFGLGRGSNTSQPEIYELKTGKIIGLDQAGAAHCFWGYGGLSAYCNNSEVFPGIQSWSFINGLIGPAVGAIRSPKPAAAKSADADYAVCKTTSFAYGSFCDEDHVIVTMGCSTETAEGLDTTMSKIVLLDLSEKVPVIIPLGKNLAEAFDGPGGSSYTASCRIQ